MPRSILDEAHVHPAIHDRIAGYRAEMVKEVLAAAGIAYHYLEYGSYFSLWRRRLALKMWTGWPTFPMVFVKGVLIGGADDLEKLIASDLTSCGPETSRGSFMPR